MQQNTQDLFTFTGIRPAESPAPAHKKHQGDIPIGSLALLGAIVLGCLGARLLTAKDPAYLDLANCSLAPNREFPFGTDTLGRDIFSCIWYGGRVSLFIGFLATAISTAIAMAYGSVSGAAPKWLDALMMRLTEIFLSIPSLLSIIFIQAILGEPNTISISIAIGITSWYSLAKIIRTEVRQLCQSEYVVASRCMGGSFFHVLWHHLMPNFVSPCMFMVVMNVRSAIVAESTLSFMGLGLPLETISWGSMLSLAGNALTSQKWWLLLIPGIFLAALLMSMTNISNWLRNSISHKEANL